MKINRILTGINFKRIFLTILYVLVLMFLSYFLFRNPISRIVFNRLSVRINQKYGLQTSIHYLGFKGLRTFEVDSLTLIPNNNDTLFHLHKAEIKLGLKNLFFFKINPLVIKLDHPIIHLTGGKDSSNYRFLFTPQPDSNSTYAEGPQSISNLNEKRRVVFLSKIMRGFFGLSTAKFIVTNLKFSYTHLPYIAKVEIPYLETSKEGFETTIWTEEMGTTSSFKLFAITDKKRNRVVIKLSGDGNNDQVPLLAHKFGLRVSFDTLLVDLSAISLLSDKIQLFGISAATNLNVFNKQLSESNVRLKSGKFSFSLHIAPDLYALDSISTLEVNDLKGRIAISYQPGTKRYILKLHSGDFDVQNLFNSLPEGLFTTLRGIKTTGEISYSLGVEFSLLEPDSLRLESLLQSRKLSIINLGSTDFTSLNDTFTHKVFNDTGYVRSIFLGPQNPDYIPLEKISRYIKDAVVTSEDGGFYHHRGFDIEGIRYAMAQNIKERKFARGGSTISMQLVKNLYLNQNKNLFRKIEEYLIVWLIESNKLVSKDRMLEIYLNIIEWGPNVYGVSEACKFYFDKSPDKVTLEEAIYLASVIPRPTKFKYCFEKDGNLKSFMNGFFSFVSSKMLSREMITQDEFDSITLNVRLTGPAKDILADTTAFVADSISIKELLQIEGHRDTSLLLH